MSKNSELQTAYDAWTVDSSPKAMGTMLSAASTVINRHLDSLGSKSPIMRSHARALLVNVLPKYDPTRGVPIERFVHQQLQPLRRRTTDQLSAVPVPERARQNMALLERKRREVSDRLGREPTEEELAEATRLSPLRIRRIRKMQFATVPESKFVDEEGGENLPGVSSGPKREDLIADYVYHDLAPVDKAIFELIRDGIPKVEIAQKLKMSPASVTLRSARIASKLESFYEVKSAKIGDTHDYSTVMYKIPEHIAARIVTWGRKHILDDELYTVSGGNHAYGREDEIHVTVKYGLDTNDPADVQDVIGTFGPISVSVGAISRFRPPDKEYDVVKIEISGKRLHMLHRLLGSRLKNSDEHSTYNPHVTIAYVKKGCCVDLVGMRPIRESPPKIDTLVFVDQSGRHTSVSLMDRLQ